MAEKKYLDKLGLTYLVNKIKALIPTKTSDLTNDSNYTTNDLIIVGNEENVTENTKLLIEDDEPDIVSEVVNSLAGNEIAKAPSVRAVNEAIPKLTRKTYNAVAASSGAVTPYNAYAFVNVTIDKEQYGEVLSVYAVDEWGVAVPCAYTLFNNTTPRISISCNLAAPNITVYVTYLKYN